MSDIEFFYLHFVFLIPVFMNVLAENFTTSNKLFMTCTTFYICMQSLVFELLLI